MPKRGQLPIALTIAGSDSGGGAGIQADLKTFASLEVRGASAVTCLTAQNPRVVLGIEAAKPEIVRRQMEAVFAELRPAAIKTGMLFAAATIRTVASFLRESPRLPLVVDPVMVATSGARLIRPSGMRALQDDLLPLAALATPNLDEAALLVGHDLQTVEDLRGAAKELHGRFGCAVVVKGGHLRGLRQAADIFFDGRTEWLLTAPFVAGVSTHGTGCVFSAAVTAYLALGRRLPDAVASAKTYITHAIAQSQMAGEHSVLNCFWGHQDTVPGTGPLRVLS